jgi:hypothetical protein
VKIIIGILLLLSFQANAETSSTSHSDVKHHKNKKQNKFSLEFLITSEQTKNIVTAKHDGSYSELDASLLHRLSPNDEIRYFLSTRYVDSQMENFGNEFEFFFAEFMYRRKNILTQDKNGIYMAAELKNYRVIDPDIKHEYNYDGSVIPQLIFKKSWGRRFSTKLKVRRHFYQTNNDSNYTLENEDRIYLSTSYFINRWSMAYAQLKYQHKIRKGDGIDYRFMELASYNRDTHRLDFSNVPDAKKNQEIVTLHTGFLYFLSRQNMLEVYAETKLSNTYDKREIDDIAHDELVFGTALYLTAF